MANPAPAAQRAAVPPHPSFPLHVAFAASPPRSKAAPSRALAAAATATAPPAPAATFSSSSSSSACPDRALAAEALLPLLAFLDTVRAAEGSAQPAPAYDDARAGACAEAAAEAAAATAPGGWQRRRPGGGASGGDGGGGSGAAAAEGAAAAAAAPPPPDGAQADAGPPTHHHHHHHGQPSSGGRSMIAVRGSNGGGGGGGGGGGTDDDDAPGRSSSSNHKGDPGLALHLNPHPHRPASSVAQRWLHLWRHGRGSRHFSPEELRRGADRLWQASTRGAAVGVTLRGGLHAVGALAGAIASVSSGARGGAARAARGGAAAAPQARPPRPRRGRPAVSPAEALLDTLRYGAFLGALAGAMVGADEAIAATVGRRNSAGWRALVAGVCAGPSLLLTGPQSRHYSLATYVLLRGVTLLVRVGNKRVVGGEEEDEEDEEEERRQQQQQQQQGGRAAPDAAAAAATAARGRRRRAARRLLRALLWPTRLRHGDVLLMCLACSQILYAFIIEPASLPPSYVRFVLRQGDKDPAVWAAIRELASRTRAADAAARAAGLSGAAAASAVARAVSSSPLESLTGSPALAAAAEAARRGVVAAVAEAGGASVGGASVGGGGGLAPLACAFFHPGQSCAGHAIGFVPGAWLRALRVYLPVYLLPMLLVHRGRLLSPGAALPLLRRAAVGVARSSLFLSLAIGLAFGGACCGFRLSGRATGPVIAAWTWPAGLATFAEKKSRRMELALYVAARSLESLSRCLAIWGYLPPMAPMATTTTPTTPTGGGRPAPLGASSASAARALAARHRPGAARPPLLLPPTPSAAARALLSAALRRYDVLLFALGCGAIAHCYGGSRGENRDVFRSKYLAVFDFVFGNAGFSAGAVRHEPSNADLLRGAGMRVARSIGRISSMTGVSGLGSGGSLAAMAAATQGAQGRGAGPSRLAPPPASPVLARGGGGGGGIGGSSSSSSSSSSTSSIGSNSSNGGGAGSGASRGGGGGGRGKEEDEEVGPPSPSFVSAASGGVAAAPSSSVATFATANSREG